MTASKRYDSVAMSLHWALAVLVAAMVPAGWWMSDAITEPETQMQAFQVFQIHKSVGFTILALTLVRLAWRLTHRAPPMPASTPAWQRAAAVATHWIFYALLILIPVSGWVYVSTGWSAELARPVAVPTLWFGLFEIPHLPFVADQPLDQRIQMSNGSGGAHSALVWLGILLVGLHVAAALKHQFMDRDDVLARMVPGWKPSTKENA